MARAAATRNTWWMDFICDDDLERMASEDPVVLLTLIEGGTLQPASLTFAAEYAGRTPDVPAIRRTLVPLLSHPSPLVREGALYGVRRAAAGVLEDI